MKRENISKALSGIDTRFIQEADAAYEKQDKKICKGFFLRLPVAAAIIICLLIGNVAYAAISQNWSSSIIFDDGSTGEVVADAGFKKIPETAPKVDRENGDTGIEMSLAEVERTLGFGILGYEDVYSNKIYYDTGLNDDGSIGRVDLWWPLFVSESEDKNISVSISMLNEGADEGYVSAFKEGIDASGEKVHDNTQYVEAIDTTVILYSNKWSEERITAVFEHNDIIYIFIGNNFSEEEIINIIKALR